VPILTILKGRRFERELAFDKDNFFIGREEGNDLILDDGSISRVHAKFVKDPGGWSIADLNSTNGVYVNNARSKEMPIKEGDVLVLGEYTFFVRSVESAVTDDLALESSYVTLETMCRLTSMFRGPISFVEMLSAMTDSLLEVFRAERGFIMMRDPKTGSLAEPTVARHAEAADAQAPISKTVAGQVLADRKPVLITDVEADEKFRGASSIASEQVRSIVCGPILSDGDEVMGVAYLDSRTRSRAFTQRDLEVFERFLEHASFLLSASAGKEKLRADNENLRALAVEVSLSHHDTGAIVGSSPRMKSVLDQIQDLAPEDVTVLLTGESGTGKELVAQAIHSRSKRADRPFVAVNCMALARELIESELFGHEKGAFSGAVARRVGKFEQAAGGTIFLDEIGELSGDVQVKLLRVLQERTICPVGGNREVPLDIRLITATNRDLQRAIADGKFREDLFYRINVFNLELPPLRERREDVSALAAAFVGHFRRRMGKPITGVDPDAMARLARYDWPGNVRELRNVIERAFVVERSPVITVASLPFAVAQGSAAAPAPTPAARAGETGGGSGAAGGADSEGYPDNFEVAREVFEKHFIIQALKRRSGNVTLTARETGLPRRTLYRRLAKYAIDPRELLSDESLNDMAAALRDDSPEDE
jgi:transcriptional regulator with GAF, ATPase, and Fis domain